MKSEIILECTDLEDITSETSSVIGNTTSGISTPSLSLNDTVDEEDREDNKD